jgi:hypothetical protein
MNPVKEYNFEDMIRDASKSVPTAASMDIYMTQLRDAISSSVNAMENGQDSTAAMYIGEAAFCMKHIDALWDVIMQRK